MDFKAQYQQQMNDDTLYILGSCEVSEKQFSNEKNTLFPQTTIK